MASAARVGRAAAPLGYDSLGGGPGAGRSMRRLKTRALIAAAIAMMLAPLLAAAAPAAAPFAFAATPGRLPKTVVPVSYSVSIVPDIDALTFSGTESVRLQIRSATDTLVLNSLNETLHDVRLDGRSVKSVTTDDSQQPTTITLAAAAPAALHTLTFAYSGKIEQQPHG